MVGGRELTRSRGPWSVDHGRERERLAALHARRSGSWRKKMWRVFESDDGARPCSRFEHRDERRRLQSIARRREHRGTRADTAADATAVVRALLGRMRVVRRTVGRMVTGRVFRGVASARRRHDAKWAVGQFRSRARVHGTDVHHRRLAHGEDEPDGEERAEHAGDQITTHSFENYLGRGAVGIFRVPGGLAEWLMHRS